MRRTHAWKSARLVYLATLLATLGPAHVLADERTYMDDRSTPQKLVESYYFAVSNRYYAQAYSYFQENTAPADFDRWVNGYSDTSTVQVRFGPTAPDPGAGQIHWALPVVILAAKTDGTKQVFAGCYKIHMANPGMQSDPPYQPMGIVSATLKETAGTFETATPGPC